METVPKPDGRAALAALVLVWALFSLSGCAHRNSTSPGHYQDQGGTNRHSRVVLHPKSDGAAASKPDKVRLAEEEKRAEAYAQFATGFLHDLRDEDDQALNHFEKAIQADPGQDGLTLDVARRYLVRKENDRAIQVLRESLDKGGSGILASFLGSVYGSLGRTNDAINAHLEAIRKSPDLILGYHSLAQIYVRNDEPAKAVKILEQAGSVTNVTASFLLELAELWIGFPQAKAEFAGLTRKRALELLDLAVPRAGNEPAMLQRVADDYLLLGQNAKAIDLYLKLVERYPQATPIRERLADLLLQSKDSKRAIEQMEALIREEPSKYPQAYVILGNLALQDNKPKEAVDYLRKALVLNPGLEPVYYDLAVAQVNAGEPRAAIETLDQARAKFSETFLSEYFSGISHARLKEYGPAIQRLTGAEVIARSKETNRLTHTFYFQLGSAYERNQQWEQAERAFRRCLDLKPDFAEALNYLGYMWAERGEKLEEAHGMLERALKLEPDNAAFLDSMAWILHRQGKHAEALVFMEKSLKHTTEPDPTLWDHFGDIYLGLGREADAIRAFEKSLELERSDAVRKKLEDLKLKQKGGARP